MAKKKPLHWPLLETLRKQFPHYAALCDALERQYQAGYIDSALESAFALGELITQDIHSKTFWAGYDCIRKGREGARKRHHSETARAQQAARNRLVKELFAQCDPQWSQRSKYDWISKQFQKKTGDTISWRRVQDILLNSQAGRTV